MRIKSLRVLWLGLVALVFAQSASAYVYITNSGGQPVVWPAGTIPLKLMLDNTVVLSDGTTTAGSVLAATAAWNSNLSTVQFAPQILGVSIGGALNGSNEVFFDPNVYGNTWGSNTLAVTITWYNDTTSRTTENDLLFNPAFNYDSFRGSLRPTAIDLRRVALHELGHWLGLDHPDQNGQYVTAIMNSTVSDIDSLQADDIAGAQSLYGLGYTAPSITSQPANQTVYAGLPGQFTIAVTGNPTPTLQWQRQPAATAGFADLSNDGTYSGVTSATLTINSATIGMSGDQFRCIATNLVSGATSLPRTLTVVAPLPPSITLQPSNQSHLDGGTASFTMAAASLSAITYQWQLYPASGSGWSNVPEGGIYSGTTTPTLALAYVSVQLTGNSYRCVATNVNGNATTNGALLTVVFSPAVIRLSAGRYHSLRLDIADNVFGTGGNTYGQVGDGTTINRTSSSPITTIGQVPYAIAAGGQHSVFLTARDVWSIGSNDHGQLGDGTTTPRSSFGVLTTTGAIGIAAGLQHTAILKVDGTLWALGCNDRGQLGNGTMTDAHALVQVASSVIDFATGGHQTLFVKSDGTLWGTGDLYGNSTQTSVPIQIATNVQSVAAGAYHSIFLKNDGTVWTLGSNGFGQLGNATLTTQTTPVQIASNAKSVAAGYYHSLFIKTDNTLWSFGANDSGQIGDASTTNRLAPYQMANNVAVASASESYTLFTKTDGSLWGTGLNASGQFGNGTTASTTSPIYIIGGRLVAPNYTGLNAGGNTAQDRVILTWNQNFTATSYEILRGTTSDQASATRIASNLRWPYYEDLNVVDGTSYYYWIVSVNAEGTSTMVTGTPFTYHSLKPPVFTVQPTNQAANTGNLVVFTLGVTGDPTPTLQWQRLAAGTSTWVNQGGNSFAFNVSNYLTLAATADMNGDQYRCVASNTSGTVTSNIVTLSVESGSGAPQILLQPVPTMVRVGDAAKFTVAVTGAPVLHLQWQIQGDDGISWYDCRNPEIFTSPAPPPVFGFINSPTLLINTTGQTAMNGRLFRCVVTNTLGSATSDPARLSYSPVVSDMNGDAQSDILWENTVTGARGFWLMNGTTFSSWVDAGNVSPDLRIVGTGDFNGDGTVDIVWENTVTGKRVVWFMNGTNFVSSASLGIVTTDWHIAAVGDFNGDAKPDILWENTVTGDRGFWLMNGTNLITWVDLGIVGTDWRIAGCGLFTNNGQTDILWENTTTGDHGIWLMFHTSLLDWVDIGNVTTDWRIAGLGDFNGDVKPDILWENTTSGLRYIWLMNGTSMTSAIAIGTVSTDWRIAN